VTTASPLTGFVPWTIFLSSCSRGALLESVLKRGRMRRLRVVSRKHTSGRPGVTVRAHYGALPQVGWTRAGERGEIRGMASKAARACTRKHGPPAKNRRGGAPDGDARRRPVSHPACGSRQRPPSRHSGAPPPLIIERRDVSSPRAHGLRERRRVAGCCSLNVLVLS
jgi:hypothetical protein